MLVHTEVFLKSWTEKHLQDQKSTLNTFYGVFFGVGSMAWIAFGSACIWLFLKIAVRVARSFHTMLLETMLKFVNSFPPTYAQLLTPSAVPQWTFSSQTTADAL